MLTQSPIFADSDFSDHFTLFLSEKMDSAPPKNTLLAFFVKFFCKGWGGARGAKITEA